MCSWSKKGGCQTENETGEEDVGEKEGQYTGDFDTNDTARENSRNWWFGEYNEKVAVYTTFDCLLDIETTV